jgi:hypothetical protein
MLAAPVWIWAAFQIAWEARHEGRTRLRALGVPAAAGLAVSIGLAIVIQVWFQAPNVAPTFAVGDDNALIREQFRLMTDVHRRPYPFVRFGYLANVVAFLALGSLAVLLRRSGPAPRQGLSDWSAVRSVLVFGAIVWTYVIGTYAFQHLAGWLPGPLLLSMPSRFSNYSAVLLVPITVTVLLEALGSADVIARRSLAFLFGSLLMAAAMFSSGITTLVDATAVSNNLLVLIWGTTLGALAVNNRGNVRRLAIAAALALAAAFAAFWSSTGVLLYFAAAWLVGLLGCWFGQRSWGRLEPTWEAAYSRVPLALAIVVGVVATNTAAGKTADRFHPGFVRWDMLSDDDRAIDEWLNRNARPDELVLVTLLPRPELQGKTGQPVLFEAETLWLMTYMPRLAPLIGTMAKDLYGVDYTNPAELETLCGDGVVSIGCATWTRAWTRRSREEWKNLSSKYGFRLVLAPSGVKLDVEAAFKGDRWTLYRIH